VERPSSVHVASNSSVSLDIPLADVPSTPEMAGSAPAGRMVRSQAHSRAASSSRSRLERCSSVTSDGVPVTDSSPM
jgi:hypothetical protein